MTKENENMDAVQAEQEETAANAEAEVKDTKAAKDTKASAKKSAPKKKQQKKNQTGFWKGVKQEMSRVIWPTRKELGQYTLVTIVFCAIFAAGFWLIDTGFLAFLKAMFGVTLS